MAVSPARVAAFEILLRVEREQSYADELLHSARYAKLSPADHRLATELVMGVLRWRSRLDLQLAEASLQKIERLDEEVLTALRLGVYQLKFLSRVPARAAIFESVELVKKARKRSAGSFVNAVLRKLAATQECDEPSHADVFADIDQASIGQSSIGQSSIGQSSFGQFSDPVALAHACAHPEWLVERWVAQYGMEKARRMCAYSQHAPATSIRIYDEQALNEFTREGGELGAGQLISAARMVLSGNVTRTSAYREGAVAIQDEGSQLVALLVGQGKRILDCCAAPGGKAMLLARRNPAAIVVASELHVHRARLLQELVRLSNLRIVAADARRLPFSLSFDRILADVPCSGTGTLARNPEIKWRLRAEGLRDLQLRQIAILKSALAQLAAGGRLVYSTCSMEREENEDVVEAVLDETPEFSIVDCQGELARLRESGDLRVDEITTLLDGPYLRTVPGMHGCDGFFAAVVERKYIEKK